MSILNWNSSKVKNLTGTEIWLFIIARLLIGFGVGVVACRYYSLIVGPAGVPAVVLGCILFAAAARGLARTT
jgi:hypothetical protein